MSAGSTPRVTRPEPGAHSAAQGPQDGHALAGAAVRRVQALAAIVRARDVTTVATVLDPLTREELIAALVAAAAMLPARFAPAARLAWIELDPREWSVALLTHETLRYDQGDRDATAEMAHQESGRRLAEMQQRAS